MHSTWTVPLLPPPPHIHTHTHTHTCYTGRQPHPDSAQTCGRSRSERTLLQHSQGWGGLSPHAASGTSPHAAMPPTAGGRAIAVTHATSHSSSGNVVKGIYLHTCSKSSKTYIMNKSEFGWVTYGQITVLLLQWQMFWSGKTGDTVLCCLQTIAINYVLLVYRQQWASICRANMRIYSGNICGPAKKSQAGCCWTVSRWHWKPQYMTTMWYIWPIITTILNCVVADTYSIRVE